MPSKITIPNVKTYEDVFKASKKEGVDLINSTVAAFEAGEGCISAMDKEMGLLKKEYIAARTAQGADYNPILVAKLFLKGQKNLVVYKLAQDFHKAKFKGFERANYDDVFAS